MTSDVAVVIPARYAASRLPGKPLIPIAGKPMIQWVYERALQIRNVSQVIVATDDLRIADTVKQFGGVAIMTPENCANGSERVGIVAHQIDADIVVNLQGDEPLISPAAVTQAIMALQQNPALSVATLGFPLEDAFDWQNPAIVKVLVNCNMQAIYFSRAPIPHPRDDEFQPLPLLFRHIGVYVYRKNFLLQFLEWPEGVLEKVEKLEQLRIVERGFPIHVVLAESLSPGVDTPEDLPKVEELIKQRGQNG